MLLHNCEFCWSNTLLGGVRSEVVLLEGWVTMSTTVVEKLIVALAF
jgi:hypothetical protein